MTENEVARQIADGAYRVHSTLGPGLLESAYQAFLAFELESRGLRVVRQQAIPIIYHGTRIEIGFWGRSDRSAPYHFPELKLYFYDNQRFPGSVERLSVLTCHSEISWRKPRLRRRARSRHRIFFLQR